MPDNVALARRWFQEVWNERKAETIAELLDADSIGHTSAGEVRGHAEWKQKMWDPLMAAFSEVRVDVEDVVSDADTVVLRWRAHMKHTGAGLGIPASGRDVSFTGITWLEIRNGRITKGWDGWDSTGMLLQCGGASLHPALQGM